MDEIWVWDCGSMIWFVISSIARISLPKIDGSFFYERLPHRHPSKLRRSYAEYMWLSAHALRVSAIPRAAVGIQRLVLVLHMKNRYNVRIMNATTAVECLVQADGPETFQEPGDLR